MFELTVRTDNAAFTSPSGDAEPEYEVARILRSLAAQIEAGAALREGTVRDSNGSTVGSWVFA